MKALISLFFTVTNIFVFGQDTLYLDKNFQKIATQESAAYIQIEHRVSETPPLVERTTYSTGQKLIKKERFMINTKAETEHYRKYHLDEQKDQFFLGFTKEDEVWVNHGELVTYWENGNKKRQDLYEYGYLVEGTIWDINGNQTTYMPYFLQPSFKGGEFKRMQFLNSKLKYPRQARKSGIEGTVNVRFIVEKDGRVSNVNVKDGVHELLDNEALRVTKLMPVWNPGMKEGIAVRVEFFMPVRFVLK